MRVPVIQVTDLKKAYFIGESAHRQDDLQETLVRLAGNFFGSGKKKKVGQFWALRGISFSVSEGEVLGVIGPNGAGKSTLLKVLSRVTLPTMGEIKLLGCVGSLLEVGTGFHRDLTGRENIYLSGAILGMGRKEIARKFDEIVDFAEVAKFLDTPVKRYSSGMYMRLAFAVAAHLDSEILLIDEVLAVGDAQFQKKCLGKMESVSQGGRTVLFVSHNLPAISRICSRTIRLDDGRIVDDGPSEQVVSNYLAEQSGGEMSVSYDPNPEQALRLRRISVVSPEGKPLPQVAMGKGFRVQIAYDVNRPVQAAHVFCRVQTPLGLTVLGSGDADTNPSRLERRQVGQYISEFQVSPFLLAEGRYSLSVAAGVPYKEIYDSRNEAVVFSIVDNESQFRRWLHQGRPGLLGLEIPWNTEKVETLGADPYGNPEHEKNTQARRHFSHSQAETLAEVLNSAFALSLKPNRIQKLAQLIRNVEANMIGRIAGDVDDQVLNYFVRYQASQLLGSAPGAHVEIGTLFGGSLVLMLHALNDARSRDTAITIDPFEGYYNAGNDPVTRLSVCENHVRDNLMRCAPEGVPFKIISARSEDASAIQRVAKQKVKSLWIDGDHSFEGVKRDWENYSPFVVPKGYVLIDNYHDEAWPEVSQYVDEYILPNLSHWKVVCVNGYSILFQRLDDSPKASKED